jgi:hypothetical protein
MGLDRSYCFSYQQKQTINESHSILLVFIPDDPCYVKTFLYLSLKKYHELNFLYLFWADNMLGAGCYNF